MNNDITIGGKWNILDKEYQGDLTFNKNNGMIILSVYYKNDSEFFTWMNKPTEIDVITGKLNQEIKCTLTDCKIVKRHSDSFIRHHIVIIAKTIFFNIYKKNANQIKFNEVHFQIPNIIKWSNLSGFEYFDDSSYRLKIGYKFKDKISQKINNDTTIEFVPVFGKFNYDMQLEKLDISQHIEIYIKKKNETTFNEFLSDFKMVKNLIMLATGVSVNISQINGINYKKINGKVGKKKSYIKYEIVNNSLKYNEKINLDNEVSNNYLFSLNEIADKERLKTWFDTYNEYKNVYDLYNLGTDNDITNEIRFCNLMQALELIHTKKYKKVKSFLTHIDEKFKDNNYIIDLIKNNPDQTDQFVLLKNRLIDLFINDFKMTESEKIIDNIDLIATIFSDTRHYYTHYDDAKKDKCLVGENLKYGIFVLDYLLSNYILLNLNFDIKSINERKDWQINHIKNMKMIEKILKNERI